MPQHDMEMAAIEQMLSQAGPGAGAAPPMPGPGPGLGGDEATLGLSGGEVDSAVVAGLVAENVQLRAALGLGPDDPVPPAPGGPLAAGGAGLPPVAGPSPF